MLYAVQHPLQNDYRCLSAVSVSSRQCTAAVLRLPSQHSMLWMLWSTTMATMTGNVFDSGDRTSMLETCVLWFQLFFQCSSLLESVLHCRLVQLQLLDCEQLLTCNAYMHIVRLQPEHQWPVAERGRRGREDEVRVTTILGGPCGVVWAPP